MLIILLTILPVFQNHTSIHSVLPTEFKPSSNSRPRGTRAQRRCYGLQNPQMLKICRCPERCEIYLVLCPHRVNAPGASIKTKNCPIKPPPPPTRSPLLKWPAPTASLGHCTPPSQLTLHCLGPLLVCGIGVKFLNACNGVSLGWFGIGRFISSSLEVWLTLKHHFAFETKNY